MSARSEGELTVRRLRPEDDRSTFRSGNPDLDRFFVRFAGQNQFRHHVGTTYVAVDAASNILGFVTVVASELLARELPRRSRRKFPRYPLPVLRLARLAVSEAARGRGVGSLLLRAAFAIAMKMAQEIGCVGLVVDAKPDAVTFYERLGFERLDVEAGLLGDRPEPLPMFLELAALDGG